MIFGFDNLGGARYPNVILRSHKRGAAFGCFLEVDGFGKADGLIEEVAKRKLASVIRVQGLWRDKHDFNQTDVVKAENFAIRVQRIASKYPEIGWYFSPFCEHNFNEATMRAVAAIIKRACPSAKFVNSPNKGVNTFLRNEINEIHGTRTAPRGYKYIYSYDGYSAEDSNIPEMIERHKNAELFMFWVGRHNGLWEVPKEGEPRPPRSTRKGWVDDKMMRAMWDWTSFTSGSSKFPPYTCWKAFSENHGEGSNRDEKPVMIIPVKVPEITIKDTKGGLLYKLKEFPGPIKDSPPWSANKPGYRYYSPVWGFELADKARRRTGCRLVVIEYGKTKLTIDPAIRHGTYR